ncbi:hypothetical protein CDL15_Pgr027302 [Punica granatum]|uniref:Uncharacterized protein n=1 Tax=Punica granatum TaxID=22663 RepID=A0A218XSB6_PUNGR|nr:hypothetical protein CDL15_Pgr027302 [Punica granatum]
MSELRKGVAAEMEVMMKMVTKWKKGEGERDTEGRWSYRGVEVEERMAGMMVIMRERRAGVMKVAGMIKCREDEAGKEVIER